VAGVDSLLYQGEMCIAVGGGSRFVNRQVKPSQQGQQCFDCCVALKSAHDLRIVDASSKIVQTGQIHDPVQAEKRIACGTTSISNGQTAVTSLQINHLDLSVGKNY
jgi:hypothetical protein